MIIVDDHNLFCILAHVGSEQLIGLSKPGVATTSSWYYRLARAVASDRIDGALSSRIEHLAESDQAQVRKNLSGLPPFVNTKDPRHVVPLMAALSTVVKANFILLEAIALAITLDADIVTATRSPLLDQAAELLHLNVVYLR